MSNHYQTVPYYISEAEKIGKSTTLPVGPVSLKVSECQEIVDGINASLSSLEEDLHLVLGERPLAQGGIAGATELKPVPGSPLLGSLGDLSTRLSDVKSRIDELSGRVKL